MTIFGLSIRWESSWLRAVQNAYTRGRKDGYVEGIQHGTSPNLGLTSACRLKDSE